MATFQWKFDAPATVFKNWKLSRRLYIASVERSVCMDHVRPIEGFGRKMGESVTLTRIANLTEPVSADLIEGERIPEDQFSISTRQITVKEIGRAVPFTSFADDLSFFDLDNPIQDKLRQQMTLVLDTKCGAAFKTTKVKYAPTGLASNNITTNGTFGATATANMNVFHAEEIVDFMFDNLQVEGVDGEEDYVGIFRNLALRGIKRDPAWEEWHKYTDPQAKFNNEVGKLENLRFVKTNHNKAFGKVGTGSVLGEGVVFGRDAVAMVEARTPQLIVGVSTDFGRDRAVAWYGILEFGNIWDTGNAGEAKILHVGSL
ncbi:MAG: phage major capsid protein [Nitrospira sp.]|nr:phage major capsid protein [Nitrospira sp.]